MLKWLLIITVGLILLVVATPFVLLFAVGWLVGWVLMEVFWRVMAQHFPKPTDGSIDKAEGG